MIVLSVLFGVVGCVCVTISMLFFCFKQKTAYEMRISDWSSNVCSSDLVVKIVNDGLTEMLGSETSELMIDVTPPAIVMMVGLQGSGKTTTTAKIAKRLKEKERKKVLMASLDVNRPAAQEQLATLGTQTDVATLTLVQGQKPVVIARSPMQKT